MSLLDAINHPLDWGQQFWKVTYRWLNNFTLYTINGSQQAVSVQSQTSVHLKVSTSPNRDIFYKEKKERKKTEHLFLPEWSFGKRANWKFPALNLVCYNITWVYLYIFMVLMALENFFVLICVVLTPWDLFDIWYPVVKENVFCLPSNSRIFWF